MVASGEVLDYTQRLLSKYFDRNRNVYRTLPNIYKGQQWRTFHSSWFRHEQIFVVRKVVKTPKDNYLYWTSKEGNNKLIDKGFLRQELFALNDQFA